MSAVTPVVLCGGSGTRLWPLSRKSFPKQFVPLIGNKSLLQLTLARLAWCGSAPICVASEDHRFLVADAMESQGSAGQVLLEPAARNTAAAMTLAALLAHSPADADPLLLFCPSDHHIPDVEAFAHTIRQGVPAAEAAAATASGARGAAPNRPALGPPAARERRLVPRKPAEAAAAAAALAECCCCCCCC